VTVSGRGLETRYQMKLLTAVGLSRERLCHQRWTNMNKIRSKCRQENDHQLMRFELTEDVVSEAVL
jgi:hypothetical protein